MAREEFVPTLVIYELSMLFDVIASIRSSARSDGSRCIVWQPSEPDAVTMVKTEIINATEGVLCLKEGNAGVYRSIKNLEAKGKFVIEVDPNATYREYVVVSTPSDEKVFITSDDCIDNAKITVVADPTTGAYKFNGNPRGDTTAVAPTDEPAPGGFLSRLKKNLPWKK